MSPIEWLRSKSKVTVETEFLAGMNVEITRYYFRGVLPAIMFEQLKKTKLEQSSDFVHENIRLGGQYRSDYGKCEYWYTLYRPI